MNKTQLKGEGLSFWAKRSDTVSHITKDHGTLCGKYVALLGNNYASDLDQVCSSCLRHYNNSNSKAFSVNGSDNCTRLEIVIHNPDIYQDILDAIDSLKVGDTLSLSGASCSTVTRIS